MNTKVSKRVYTHVTRILLQLASVRDECLAQVLQHHRRLLSLLAFHRRPSSSTSSTSRTSLTATLLRRVDDVIDSKVLTEELQLFDTRREGVFEVRLLPFRLTTSQI